MKTCFIEVAECGKRSLAKTDSSVVRRHCVVSPDFKPVGLEERSHVFKQQLVLEDTSGEHNCIDLVAVAKLHNSLDRSRGYATLEGTRNFRYCAVRVDGPG